MRPRATFRAFVHRVRDLGEETASLRSALIRLTDLPFEPADEPLIRAQREITEHCTVEDYAALYRGEELLYWLHLPGWITEWAKDSGPRHIVDIGAGYGTLAVFASLTTGARVSCMDISTSLLSSAIVAAHGLEVVEGNVELTDLPWQGVDGVLMTEVIEHFNFHPVPTMRKVHDSLAPGGRLFLSTPDAASWGRVDDPYLDYRDMPHPDPSMPIADRHVYQFTRDELIDVLEASGFRILRLDRAPGRWGFHLNVEAERGRGK
jgi:SAM-dependent methyltransferase